ncbi:hypothetical protein HK104_006355, partial [Borealophlyctis nickersoniae]
MTVRSRECVMMDRYHTLKTKLGNLEANWYVLSPWYWVNSTTSTRKVIKDDMLDCISPVLVATNSDVVTYASSHRKHIGDLYRSNFIVVPKGIKMNKATGFSVYPPAPSAVYLHI